MTVWQLDSSIFPDLLPMTGRSPGIHVSDVIARLKGYDVVAPTNEQLGRMQLGCALEWAIIKRYALHDKRISDDCGELEKGGIFGTPDGRIVSTHCYRDRIVEIKLTWMRAPSIPVAEDISSVPENLRDGILDLSDKPVATVDSSILFDEKFFAWRTQLMSYCYMYGTAHGRLIAAFVRANGECDWRDWSVDFDRVDLVKNWAMIASCAEVMQKE